MDVTYDAMGPLTAVRMWRVQKNGLLTSIAVTEFPWQPKGYETALHSLDGGLPMNVIYAADFDENSHVAPVSGCTCGIWSCKDELPANLAYHVKNGLLRVISGEVEIWGRVIEHQYGYRSEHARITKLFNPPNIHTSAERDLYEQCFKRYDVPVEDHVVPIREEGDWGKTVRVTWNASGLNQWISQPTQQQVQQAISHTAALHQQMIQQQINSTTVNAAQYFITSSDYAEEISKWQALRKRLREGKWQISGKKNES